MFTKALSKLNSTPILIIGMAREGLSTVEFLLKQVKNPQLFVTDTKVLENLDPYWKELLKQHQNLTYLTTEEVQQHSFRFAFKSPGIPQSVLEQTYQLDITALTITSNTQLFFDCIHSLDTVPLTIGVTGTKGKSTTTSQIFHVLSTSLESVKLGGNIGVPPLRMLEDTDTIEKTIYVLEMSSHQLAELTTSPQIAVVQDISPDHLDYYSDFEAYLQAKTAICRYQSSTDIVFYNQDSQTATQVAQMSAGQKIPFSLNNTSLIDFITNSNSPLLGTHNLYNTIPAILIARHLKIADKNIRIAIAQFKPVPHRIERVKTVNEVTFYNDSAASAPEATIAAINAFKNEPLILITGGSEKGVDFSKLAQTIIDSTVTFLVLFPSTGQKILDAIKIIDPTHRLVKNHIFALSMPEAIEICKTQAQPGDTVLLSPASASFNMFKNYEDRGNQFKTAVNQL
jgi:UDP-N-acetylmuramoylalanine--D-glutamate ligase